MGRPAYKRLKGKSEGLVMPKTEWHGEIVYCGKVQPVHAWREGLKNDNDDDFSAPSSPMRKNRRKYRRQISKK
jgi:hypothetical protein